MKPGYKQTEVGVIPEKWEVRHLVDVSRKITDGDHVTPRRESHGYYLLSARNVLNGRIDVSDVDYVGVAEYQRMKQRCGPESGDILISCSGTIGRVTIVPSDFECVLVRSAALAKIDRELADSVFLHFWLQGSKAQRQIASSVNQGAQPNLFLNHIERLACPHPPLPEQRAIATALSDVDGLLGALDRLIAKKRDLKQAAMQQLLTGQTRLPGFKGEWVVKTLPDVCRFRGGKAHEQYIADHGRFVCVNSKFISTEGKVRKYATDNFCSAKAKDILMVMSDLPNGKALAKTFIADHDDLYAVNQRVCALTPFVDYCAEFLAYVLDRNPYFLKFDDGVSQTHLLNRVFQKCPVFVPLSKAEQTAIAAVLSEIDAELAGLEQRREKTRALKQGMMQELLTGKTRLV